MTAFDAVTEAYLAQLLDDAPPLTTDQVALLRRTYGRVPPAHATTASRTTTAPTVDVA